MKRRQKKVFSLILAVLMFCSVIWTQYQPLTAKADTTNTVADNNYNLPANVQDGEILHCWDWSFNNIKAQMKTIAESGYTAVQTSPIQEAKERTKGFGNSKWWLFYQPKSFVIDNSGQSGLGTKAEFESMCKEADYYGIKVIVDIVANHTGNGGANGIANEVIDDIKNDRNAYHNYGNFKDINYGNRYSITHDSMGLLPDLNTENIKIQNYVYNLLKECIDAGADGFRFDAAKHISLPCEGAEYTFWPNTVGKAKEYAKSKGINLYCYGEILDSTGGPAVSEYNKYLSVTDNRKSKNVLENVCYGNAVAAASPSYDNAVAAKNLVLWAESHDTYQNDDKATTGVSNENINKTWAIVASRADAAGLYYVRTQGWRNGQIGDICSWEWKNKEVVEANKFHNYFVGQPEYLSSNGGFAYNERGNSGVIIVNCKGTSAHVELPAKKMANGDYVDQVTGKSFKVENGKIIGDIGNTGIAVVYNKKPNNEPKATISPEGGEFYTDTLDVTIGLKNATSGTYKVGNDSEETYTGEKVIPIGKDMQYGDSVTITLTAKNSEKTSKAESYTFTKTEKVTNYAYLNLPSGWGSEVYCYAYDSATEKVNNGVWPGQKMTYDESKGLYKYEVPDNIKAPRVIFYSNEQNRYPLDKEPGLLFEKNGSWIYKDGKWEEYKESGEYSNIIVKYVDETGSELCPKKEIRGLVGSTYTTKAETISNYSVKTVPSNASGIVTKEDITVTYIYEKNVETSNIAYLKLPSGWGTTVYCYAYDSATETINNGGWPGQKMTYDVTNGLYKYEIPANIKAPRVIFYNSDSNRYPGNMEKGMLFETNGSWIYKDGNWSKYSGLLMSKVTVKYVDESGKSIATSKIISGDVGEAYKTSAASISGYSLKQSPENATGKFKATDIVVTYVYEKTESSVNTVYLKLPSGWGTTVYCYAYDSATETVNNGGWPGQKMKFDPITGYFKYEVPSNIKAPRVIFYNSNSNRFPGNMQKGMLFETDGKWLFADGNWTKFAN